jgi:periplasmic nitrate reductase NapD
MTPAEVHIASLVVHAAPSRLGGVAEVIEAIPAACIHASSEKGKLVVTLETTSADAMTQLVAGIQHIDGVLSAMLVYQCADSLEAMNEEIPDAQA